MQLSQFGSLSKIRSEGRRSEETMATRQTHGKTFKQEAVRLVQTSGKPLRQIADDLGIGMSTLSRWCAEAAENGERAFVGSGNLQPEAEEVRRLRREND